MLTIFLLCLAGFGAALVDSIAGGGGLISVPAFLAAGVPPHLALGTNKFAATAGSLTSSIRYARSAKVHWGLLKYLMPATLIGAVIGVHTVLQINRRLLNALVLALILIVGVYSLFSRTLGAEDRFRGINPGNVPAGMALALFLGFYDGFFGPGTGSFLMFGLIMIYGFDFLHSGGNARVLNFISNITSLALFIYFRKVDYFLGVPVALAMAAGAQVGSKLALTKGAKVVKPVFITIALAVAAKMLWGLRG
ncbi:MAG: TSUP family transporter [Bacillota bacterium]